MPIDITNLQTKKPQFTPKFFSSHLTGSGKKTGLLNETRDPKNFNTLDPTDTPDICFGHKRTWTATNTKTTRVPLDVLPWDTPDILEQLPAPTNLTQIGTLFKKPLFVAIDLHSVVTEQTIGDKTNSKRVLLTYKCTFVCSDTAPDPYTPIESEDTPSAFFKQISNQPTLHVTYTRSVTRLFDIIAAYQAIKLDKTAVDNLINSLSCYDLAVRQSKHWQTDIDKELNCVFDIIANGRVRNLSSHQKSRPKPTVDILTYILHHIESYNVPLASYWSIYNTLKSHFAKPPLTQKDFTAICDSNLNLMLASTLHNLDNVRNSVQPLPCDTQTPKDTLLSNEQKAAVMTTSPFTAICAGAGTGKSHCILARVDQMINCGIDPADILVLSFTNAATNHIATSTSRVRSMTIATMIHNIYQANFPTHALSTIQTLQNALDIYFKGNDIAYLFKKHLQNMSFNEDHAYTELNNFIKHNYNAVIRMLNKIEQTTLELEIIIAYQQIDNLKEPNSIPKHIIVDETQDNSLFEFVYTWKYAYKHVCSLFIVGDANQTLYEFRGANARALNVMETSGVFDCFKIQTNYRSNQEILDFANATLADIEVNQYSQIQLHANDLTPISAQSFQDAVWLKYHEVLSAKELTERFENICRDDMKPYIEKCLARGEKVTFLAFQRKYVDLVTQWAKTTFPTHNVETLVPPKKYPSTIISRYISEYWNEIKFIPNLSCASAIVTAILFKLDRLIPQKSRRTRAETSITNMLHKWENENKALVQSWAHGVAIGNLSHKDFLERLQHNLLAFEIKYNAIAQTLARNKDAETDKQVLIENADILTSTIHSAKGLEFDNTIVLYHADNHMNEDNKRLYYVAFTRAKKSELIVAYDSLKNPLIQSQYDNIVATLENN